MGQTSSAVERENADRAVFLNSEIDATAYDKIAPIAVKLRLQNSAPICLFINSPGGNPWTAEQIMRLVRSPRQDGTRCMVTTVCIGMAASAAADLLSAGDYAIAYNDALIHVHGSRGKHSDLTIEALREVEESLREDNEYFAMKLASKMFRRFATQALLFEVFKTIPPKRAVSSVGADPTQILENIRNNVSDSHKSLVDDAFKRMNRIRQLVEYVQLTNPSSSLADPITADSHLLKLVVDFEHNELQERKKSGEPVTGFSTDTIDLIQSDFLHLKEILGGSYMEQALELCRQKGHYFLSPDEISELNKYKFAEKDKRNKFLEQKSAPKIFPLWYLVVSLCRLLQQGEHLFTASEAWYFGLIDEVTGSSLPSLRKWKELRSAEEIKKDSKTTASPVAPQAADSSNAQLAPPQQSPPSVEPSKKHP